MLNWFRDLLRRWLLNEDPRSVLLRSGEKLRANSTVGLHLMCKTRDGFPRMVAADEAADPDQFWAVYRRFNGPRKITWEDGSPADPWSFP